MLPRHHRGDDLAEQETGRVRRIRGHRDVDVQPAGAGRFGKPGRLQALELLAHPARHVQHLAEGQIVRRVQIDRHVVHDVLRLDAREPGVLRNRAELHCVQQGRERTANQVGPGFRFRGDVLDADAWGVFVGRPVLIERLRIDAVRIAFHHQGAIRQRRQDEGRHANVMAEQVAFRELQLRPEHLAEAADLQAVAGRQLQRAVAALALDGVDLVEQLPDGGLGQRRSRRPFGRGRADLKVRPYNDTVIGPA